MSYKYKKSLDRLDYRQPPFTQKIYEKASDDDDQVKLFGSSKIEVNDST